MSESTTKKFEETRPEGIKPSTRMTCMPGQVICEQGGPANQAYFIESGLVEVSIREGELTVKLAEIGPGEVFGEMGVLEQEMRMANVRAIEKSVITVMTREELEARVARIEDPVIAALINGFSKRLRATSFGQVRYFKNLANFQDRVLRVMHKANNGINPACRTEFANEIEPLLDQVERLLDKYR